MVRSFNYLFSTNMYFSKLGDNPRSCQRVYDRISHFGNSASRYV